MGWGWWIDFLLFIYYISIFNHRARSRHSTGGILNETLVICSSSAKWTPKYGILFGQNYLKTLFYAVYITRGWRKTRNNLAKMFYRNKIIIKLMKELSKMLKRSIMKCSILDLIDGKIPDEFLKGRFLMYHFIFILQSKQEILIPNSVDVYIKSHKKKNISFFDPIKVVRKRDRKVILKKGETMKKEARDVRFVKAIEFNWVFNRGDIIEVDFTKQEKVYDDIIDANENIVVYFLDPTDYKQYKDYLLHDFHLDL